MPIKHSFISTKPDTSDPTKIQASHWNADHDTSGLFVDNEIPSGALNGVNRAFVLSGSPNPAISLQLFYNGLLQRKEIDYTQSGANITLFWSPQEGDDIRCWYRK